tara:strand:+ start:465 stop:2081 length:1617 start_codon:yes stop_codon:yes gene_type:complete
MTDYWGCEWVFVNDRGLVEKYSHSTEFETIPISLDDYILTLLKEDAITEEEVKYLQTRYDFERPPPNRLVFKGVDEEETGKKEPSPITLSRTNQPSSRTPSEKKTSVPPPPAPERKKTQKNPLPPPPPPAKRGKSVTRSSSSPPITASSKGRFSFSKHDEPIKRWKYGPKEISSICSQQNKQFATIVHSDEAPVKFEKSKPAGTSTEIVFLIDSSGSMGNKMEAVKRTCSAFAEHIQKESNAHIRLALVTYGIGSLSNFPGATSKSHGRYGTISWPLMEPGKFQSISNQYLKCGISGGGGCYTPELDTIPVWEEAISQFSSPSFWKSTKNKDVGLKFVVHISDEVGNPVGVRSIVGSCASDGVIVHTMGCNSPGHTEISSQTGGKFWDIWLAGGVADLSGILEEVSIEIAKAVSLQKSSSKGKAAKKQGPRCLQTSNFPRYASSERSNQGSRATADSSISDDEGWNAIDDFSCYYCENPQYAVCPECQVHICFGGVESSVSGASTIACGVCNWEGEIDFIDSVESLAKSRSSGKGKGK